MNKTEDLTRKVFLHLRALGPISNADLAARLEVPVTSTYTCLQKLQGKGLAQQKPLGLWDITWLGRIWFRWEVKNQKRKVVY